MDIDDDLTPVGWVKLTVICAAVLALTYALFFAACAVTAWVQSL